MLCALTAAKHRAVLAKYNARSGTYAYAYAWRVRAPQGESQGGGKLAEPRV